VGSRNTATRLADAMLTDAAPEITRVTLERAYAGNDSLLKAAFQKVMPQRALSLSPVVEREGAAVPRHVVKRFTAEEQWHDTRPGW
jgi:hypothetical protein